MRDRPAFFVVAVLLFSVFAPVSADKTCDNVYIWRVESNASGIQVHVSTLINGGGTVYVRRLCGHSDADAKSKIALALAAWQNSSRVMLVYPDAAANCGATDYNYNAIAIQLKGRLE